MADTDRKAYMEKFKHWRDMFDEDEISYGERPDVQSKIINFRFDEYSCSCTVGKSNGFKVWIEAIPKKASYWQKIPIYCTCSKAANSREGRKRNGQYKEGYGYDSIWGWEKPSVEDWYRCNHMAAMFVQWERMLTKAYVGGSDESEEDKERRLRFEKESKKQIEVKKVFLNREKIKGLLAFDMFGAVEEYSTNLFYVNEYKRMLEENRIPSVSIQEEVEGNLVSLICSQVYETNDGPVRVEGKLTGSSFYRLQCTCGSPLSDDEMCSHMLGMVLKIWDYTDTLQPPDITDEAGQILLSNLHADQNTKRSPAVIKTELKSENKKKSLVLRPELYITRTGLELGMLLSSGQNMYLLRSLEALISAYEKEKTLEYGERSHADFKKSTFDQGSWEWLQLVLDYRDEIQQFNADAARMMEGEKIPKASLKTRIPLEGRRLDRFYELLGGDPIKASDVREFFVSSKSSIIRGRQQYCIRLRGFPEHDAAQNFAGVYIDAEIPEVFEGAAEKYWISTDPDDREMLFLSTVKQEDLDALEPFLAMGTGRMSFRIGLTNMADLYRRFLPQHLKAGRIVLDGHYNDEIEQLLPPAASFVFRLDYEDGKVLLDADAVYGQNRVNILNPKQEFARDMPEEDRVKEILGKIFPAVDKEELRYFKAVDDSAFYQFQKETVPTLQEIATVLGTDDFLGRKLRSIPRMQMQVSLESGLLELSISTADMSEEELLDLLRSYKKRKKYHRLPSGILVDLEDHEQLDEITKVLEDCGANITDAIKEKAVLPAYRSLYLDRFLAEHEEILSKRDKTFRTLVKNFASIRDADYEVPNQQEAVLRPYQAAGYKWLRMLYEAGFGGILADEMGLGKTVQMITLFEGVQEMHHDLPSLVVCPASLVFNWYEELSRFAPDLSVTVIAGPVASRADILREAQMPGHSQVYVTSYDLLKRDIEQYGKVTFDIVVLDEAQYIKNREAAVTKSVKMLKARQRYALTGTPIENRLSELWSIFDFLMPGFLFSESEFATRFDIPITKNAQPEATQKLKSMVRPFILRRCKTEVLKDLPEKLEEVRYAQFDDEQQKLYDGQTVRIRNMVENMADKGQDKIKILAELTRIRQICCDPSLIFENYSGGSAKREMCMDLLQSAIDGGHRILVFSQFTSMLALLEEDLNREGIPYYKITGETPKEERLRMVHAFNETQEKPVFLISLKAGGTGLNLTGADMVIHYDPWWNLAAQNQATDRAHRIGQTREVTVVRMIVKNTIEERILRLQEMKKDLADAILEGRSESLMQLSQEELLELLE